MHGTHGRQRCRTTTAAATRRKQLPGACRTLQGRPWTLHRSNGSVRCSIVVAYRSSIRRALLLLLLLGRARRRRRHGSVRRRGRSGSVMIVMDMRKSKFAKPALQRRNVIVIC